MEFFSNIQKIIVGIIAIAFIIFMLAPVILSFVAMSGK